MRSKYSETEAPCSQSKLKSNSVSLKESLMGVWQPIQLFSTNFVYRIGALGGIKRVPHFLNKNQDGQNIVVLGEQFDSEEKAKQKFLKLVWFTYRQKLKLAEGINSDVGWGCLPRVGQMLLAQSLIRLFQNKGETLNRSLYKKIILPFIDENQEEAKYSLSMILKYARWKFGINPGQWFNIGQISQVLRKLQEDNPLEGSEDLRLLFFSQSVIFTDQVFEKAGVPKCKCEPQNFICLKCHKQLEETELSVSKSEKNADCLQRKFADFTIIDNETKCWLIDGDAEQIEENKLSQSEQITCMKKQEEEQMPKIISLLSPEIKAASEESHDIEEYLSEEIQPKYQTNELTCVHKFKKQILVIISVRVCEKTIDSIQLANIQSLLDLPTNIGIIGGVPSKAIYIVGHTQSELIYLDPHFVQEHIDRQNFEESLSTFFCPAFRTINREALDPSMAFCYHLTTLQQLRDLISRIELIKRGLEAAKKQSFMAVMENDNFEGITSLQFRSSGESPNNQKSMEYSSMEFRNLEDSY